MMNKIKAKNIIVARRKKRVRAKVFGTAERPRISVFRSLNHLYVQLIDDSQGKTLLSVKDKDLRVSSQDNKTAKALAIGKILGEKALAQGIKQAVFDKGQYRYHGRIKAVAEGAREAGLKI